MSEEVAVNPPEMANTLRRFRAFFVDSFITVILLCLMTMSMAGPLEAVVTIIFLTAYYMLFIPSEAGATPGMRVAKAKAVSCNSFEKLTIRQSLMRISVFLSPVYLMLFADLAKYVSPHLETGLALVGGLLQLIIMFSVPFGKDHRGIHDIASGACVIRVS